MQHDLLDKRLEKLERSNIRLRMGLCLCLIDLVAVVLMGTQESESKLPSMQQIYDESRAERT